MNFDHKPLTRSAKTLQFKQIDRRDTVFYLVSNDHIDVWRVLHTSRDIPERMREHEAD